MMLNSENYRDDETRRARDKKREQREHAKREGREEERRYGGGREPSNSPLGAAPYLCSYAKA